MNLLEKRNQNAEAILEGRFIKRVLSETAADIDKAQRKYMSGRGFEHNDWYSGRAFATTTTNLDYTHLKKHRFLDMKTRTSSKGTNRKKSHPIHNKILWGHYNNIIKELHFGFTDAVKSELRSLQD